MRKILILTGAAGFIGLNFLEKLINHDFDYILSVDKMGYATFYNSNRYHELLDSIRSLYAINCDINDVPKLRSICDVKTWSGSALWEKTDLYILDFASESHVDNSIKDPFSIFTQNAAIPSNLLNWIGKDNWNRIKMYYHISTDEVFSELSLEDVKDESKWFKTNNNLIPNNPYSASKAAQDCFLMSMRHTFKIPVKFIRMANQFGNRQHPEKMLPASILRVLKGDTIKIYGSGENIRQWTPVDITANVILDIINDKLVFEDSIHIANRKGIYDNNQIIDILIEVLKEKGIEAKKEYIEDRKGHDMCYALHTEKVVDSYFENVEIKNYIKSTVEFYIQNKERFLK